MKVKNRSAYSMIELIFVIVITGILASVAIAKATNIYAEAKKTKVLAFVGTLNGTVSPTMYATAIRDATNPGSVAQTEYCGVLATAGNSYIVPIPEVTIAGNCNLTFTNVPDPTINTFVDGNATETPRWRVEF